MKNNTRTVINNLFRLYPGQGDRIVDLARKYEDEGKAIGLAGSELASYVDANIRDDLD